MPLSCLILAIMVFAFALATVPALGVGRVVSVAEFFAMRVKVENFIIFVGLLLLWHFLFSMFRSVCLAPLVGPLD